MSGQKNNLWSVLQQAGVVSSGRLQAGELESPWYVKVLLGFSGWLAAVFLLGFIGLGYEYIIRSDTASLVTGALMIASAYVVLRIPRNEFYEHLALAVSLAGQVLMILAIVRMFRADAEMVWFMVALLQAALVLVMPDFVHRVFSSFLSAFAFSMGLASLNVPYIFSGIVMFFVSWIWLHEFHYPRYMRQLQAVGYGLVLALIQLKGSVLFGFVSLGWRSSRKQHDYWVQPWIGELLAGLVTLYVVWTLLQRYGHRITDRVSIVTLLAVVVISVVSMEAVGITVGFVILLLGFYGSNRVLMGLGIASLLFYISSYYYLLDRTLLAKSQTLLIIGITLLLMRWLVSRLMPGNQEVSHAR